MVAWVDGGSASGVIDRATWLHTVRKTTAERWPQRQPPLQHISERRSTDRTPGGRWDGVLVAGGHWMHRKRCAHFHLPPLV